jgi:phosphoribosylanthranilate isomerase
MTVRVKICGITRVEDAEAAIAAGVDFIGLNFFAESPRYVALDRALAIHEAIGGAARVVGVFVNASRGYIDARVGALALDMLQFHGDEDEAALEGWPVAVIRAIRLKDGAGAGALRDALAHSRAEYILLDTHHPGLYGGTGQARGLDELAGLDLSRVFLSGGLGCDNVAAAAALHPYAVDSASGVESSPGVKDHAKLRSFVRNAKSAR